jgi:uncharacterized membrane protein YphA (DoxX/SURF4 family)
VATRVPDAVSAVRLALCASREEDRKGEETFLRGLFSTYPAGRTGAALLVLRAAVGVTLVMQGTFCLAGHGGTQEAWLGLTAVTCGALLTIGLFTAIGSVLALIAGGLAVFGVTDCTANLFATKLSICFAGVILVALLLVGPGAFSIDGRVFGRREIIIPPISRSQK